MVGLSIHLTPSVVSEDLYYKGIILKEFQIFFAVLEINVLNLHCIKFSSDFFWSTVDSDNSYFFMNAVEREAAESSFAEIHSELATAASVSCSINIVNE